MARNDPCVALNGASLRALRTRSIDPATGKPWTMVAFATACGVTQGYMSLLENDLRKPSVAVVTAAAAALRVNVGALLADYSLRKDEALWTVAA